METGKGQETATQTCHRERHLVPPGESQLDRLLGEETKDWVEGHFREEDT